MQKIVAKPQTKPHSAMRPQNLLHASASTEKCTMGCPVLDRCIGGGIPCGSLTEIVAESGAGKTQLCLQLALYAQLPRSHGGLSASSLYIHTEFAFPIRRLRQLSQCFLTSYPQFSNGDDPCDRVFIQGVYSAEELLDVMPRVEALLLNPSNLFPTRLIVIDSIAALFRSDFENSPLDLKRRSSFFFKISGKLKSLAKRFRLAVVVTNQVVDLIGAADGINGIRIGNLSTLYSSGRRICAALGLAWANCVNSRLFLSRNEEVVPQTNELIDENGVASPCKRTKRMMHVVFAPHLPESCCEFVIKREGVFGTQR